MSLTQTSDQRKGSLVRFGTFPVIYSVPDASTLARNASLQTLFAKAQGHSSLRRVTNVRVKGTRKIKNSSKIGQVPLPSDTIDGMKPQNI